jgi:hypothetical protein
VPLEDYYWIVLRHWSEFLSEELDCMVAYRCSLVVAGVRDGYLLWSAMRYAGVLFGVYLCGVLSLSWEKEVPVLDLLSRLTLNVV